MKEELQVIKALCPYFVCRICRTKTGWPHQGWCDMRGKTGPDCSDCHYTDTHGGGCAHPIKKREAK